MVIGLWAATGVGAAFALPGTVTDVAREVYRVVGAHPVAIGDLAAGIALLGSLALAAAAWAFARATDAADRRKRRGRRPAAARMLRTATPVPAVTRPSA